MLQVSLTYRSDQLSPQAGVSIRPTNLPAPTAYPPDAVSRRLPHTRTVPRLLLLLPAPLSTPHPVSAVIAATDLPPPPPQHTVLLPWPPHLLFTYTHKTLAISFMRRCPAFGPPHLLPGHIQHNLHTTRRPRTYRMHTCMLRERWVGGLAKP